MAAAGPDKLLSFFFRPQGRISRLEYALGAGTIMAVNAAILAFLLTRLDVAAGVMGFAFVLGLPLTVALFVIAVKRCHDFGLPGSFSLLLLVPMIGPLWLVALAVIPGKDGPNAYGAAPAFRSE